MTVQIFKMILGLAGLLSLGHPLHLHGLGDDHVLHVRDGHDPIVDDDIVDATWSEVKGMY